MSVSRSPEAPARPVNESPVAVLKAGSATLALRYSSEDA
jgi:hypothetical protein